MPLVDLGRWRRADAGRRQVSDAMGRACREWAFFSVVAHGVDAELQERLEAHSRACHKGGGVGMRWCVAVLVFLAPLAACAHGETHDVLKTELLEMLRVDQDIRERTVGAMRDLDPGTPPSAEWIALVDEQNRIDEANARRLDEIVEEHGWPGTRLVGDEASRAASIILQHSTLERQKRYLPMLRTAAADGDVEPSRVAMLEDRVRVGEGEDQLYGTQVQLDADGFVLSPVVEPERLDERRQSVGLPPIEEYLQQVEAELGRPIGRGSLRTD